MYKKNKKQTNKQTQTNKQNKNKEKQKQNKTKQNKNTFGIMAFGIQKNLQNNLRPEFSSQRIMTLIHVLYE